VFSPVTEGIPGMNNVSQLVVQKHFDSEYTRGALPSREPDRENQRRAGIQELVGEGVQSDELLNPTPFVRRRQNGFV